MQIATKTLEAIETAIYQDQGAKFRTILQTTMPLAGDAYSANEEPFRSHLGASLIGRECFRELWYSFHWAVEKKFDGRMLRLFNRGHLEEPRMVAMLLLIGCRVWQLDENGNQFRIVGHRGHFGGSMDSVLLGCPDIPGEPILGEFKTHNNKSFQKLIAEGVREAKWDHYVQMNIYMGKNNLNWALYMAVNKDDDSLHCELVRFDKMIYDQYLKKSAIIIDSPTPPDRINKSPGWFKCKFCDYSPVCHGDEMPARNCRTCYHSRPEDDGKWMCYNETRRLELLFPATNPENEDFFLSKKRQFQACHHYELNPLIKAK